jgi:hypothetical protein
VNISNIYQEAKFGDKVYSLYKKSHSEAGQMAGRQAIKDAAKSNDLGLYLPCFPKGETQAENYGEVGGNILIGSMKNFESCIEFIKKSVMKPETDTLTRPALEETAIFALGGLFYFETKMQHFAVLLEHEEGVNLKMRLRKKKDKANSFTLGDIKVIGDNVCNENYRQYVTTEKDVGAYINFCLDAGYFYTFLSVGLGLEDDQVFKPLKKEIVGGSKDKVDLSWTLGLGIETIQTV